MDPGTLSAVQGFAAVSLILVTVAIAVTALRWVWVRTGRPAAVDAGTSAQLEAALGRLDENEHRLAELEERLDFAERLLARQAESDRLAGGS